MATTDQRTALPESVTVLFPRQDSGVPAAAPTAYAVSLSSLGLTIVPGTPATFTGSRVIWSSAIAYWEGGGSPTNNTELQALANQIATDWYSWQLVPYDVTLQGWVPWACDGGHDVIIDHSTGVQQTRVSRGPWFDHVEHVLSEGTYGSSPPGGGNTVINSTTNNVNTTNNYSNSTINYGGTTTISVGGTTTTTYGSSTSTTYNGNLYIQGPTYFPPYSYSTWTANQTNLTLAAGNVRIRIATDQHFRELQSIAPGASPSGRIICLHNVGDYVILIPNEDTGSTAANRILTTTGNVYWLAPGHEVTLVYDATSSRWRVSENSDERLGGVEVYGTLAASQDDFQLDLSKRQHLFDPSANVNITGIANGQPGLRHLLVNQDDTYTITLKQEDAGSTAGNQFLLPYGVDFVIGPSMAVDVEYDDEVGFWRLVGPYQDVASLLPAEQNLFATISVAGQDDIVADDPTDTLTIVGAGGTTVTTDAATDTLTITSTTTAALTETYIGYGDGDDLLTGTADLIRVSEGVTRQTLDSDTLPPTMRMVRRRASAGSISTDDVCALWQGWGKVNGTDTILAYVEVTYTGSGTTPEGAIALWGSDGIGIFNRGLICTGDGAILVDDASTANSIVITDGDGYLINGTLGDGVALVGGALTVTPSLALTDLTDVVIASVSVGDSLVWNGSSWANETLAYGLNDLDSVNVPSPSDGQVLTWDAGTSNWIAADPGTPTASAADVTYTPAVVTDWDGDADPGNVDSALDQIAERVDDLEGSATSGTVTSVGITAPAAGITVSGSPVTTSGNMTLALADDLAAVEGLATTGIVRRTASNTWSAGTAVNLASEVTGLLPVTSIYGAGASLYPGAAYTTSVPHATITTIKFFYAEFDGRGMKSGDSLVVPAGMGGIWHVGFWAFSYFTTGAARTGSAIGHTCNWYIFVNGAAVKYAGVYGTQYAAHSWLLPLSAGDVITLRLYQDYGSTLHTYSYLANEGINLFASHQGLN